MWVNFLLQVLIVKPWQPVLRIPIVCCLAQAEDPFTLFDKVYYKGAIILPAVITCPSLTSTKHKGVSLCCPLIGNYLDVAAVCVNF